ncbi:DUF4287 domain-containing protein [Hirschia baltica]|uniref:DUF5655 domain-containing protein n=1 Tax=Hirschia baltica (strain ATCC 49814 / DSM 5838 / IFAM 1418) TaxID=582402 RepID=C6XMI4_HIRBI|nr:DUF4287 domain-containing protein [Hirschia baltica]ACT58127.1 conserved hypothetical protein [Hirschia baltica ATCC 49814]
MALQDQYLETMIQNMPDKTGKSLEEWFSVLAQSNLSKHGELMKILKADHGVTHGFANTIVHLFRQKSEPQEEDPISAQYGGAKAALFPIYETIISIVQKYGDDVEIAPKKAYVSLRRSKQFALVQPSTKSRVDLGISLKGQAGEGKLEAAKNPAGMVSHNIKLMSVDDIDEEVEKWLQLAYDNA